MRILLTNDDGVQAPGIAELARALSAWVASAPHGDVREALVVAPHTNYSGMSAAVGDVFERSSVQYRRHVIEGAENIAAYGLDAPPALCTILGTLGSFDFQPDLVVSGINAGANVGRSILHSGTVGAILTGAQMGLSGLAVSVQWGDPMHYATAAAVALEVIAELDGAPACTLLNLNVPNLETHELRGVRRGHVSRAGVVKSAAARNELAGLGDEGELALRVGAASPEVGDVSDEAADDDGALVTAGFASLTPLRGPHEETDAVSDDALARYLSVISRHLGRAAHSSSTRPR